MALLALQVFILTGPGMLYIPEHTASFLLTVRVGLVGSIEPVSSEGVEQISNQNYK
jgi:hypothetical protein